MKNKRRSGKELPLEIKELVLKRRKVTNIKIVALFLVTMIFGVAELLCRHSFDSTVINVQAIIAFIPILAILVIGAVCIGYAVLSETKAVKNDNFSWRYGCVTELKQNNSMLIDLYVDGELVRTYRAKGYKKNYAQVGDYVYVVYYGEHTINEIYLASKAKTL